MGSSRMGSGGTGGFWHRRQRSVWPLCDPPCGPCVQPTLTGIQNKQVDRSGLAQRRLSSSRLF